MLQNERVAWENDVEKNNNTDGKGMSLAEFCSISFYSVSHGLSQSL